VRFRVQNVEGRGVKRFRGGLVFKAHRLCVSINSRLESNKEEEGRGVWFAWAVVWRRVLISAFASACATLQRSVLDLRTNPSQKCEAVPRRARI